MGDLEGRSWWEKPKKRTERLERILAYLREDARMPLAGISRRTGIPTSTVFDVARAIQGRFWFTAVFLDEETRKARDLSLFVALEVPFTRRPLNGVFGDRS